MRTLLITRKLDRASELFIHRHIQMLADSGALADIAALLEQDNTTWNEIAVHGMLVPSSRVNPFYRLARKIVAEYFPRLYTSLTPPVISDHWHSRLHEILADTRPDVLLCEYATTAVDLLPALEAASRPVVVHTHGYDVHAPEHLPAYRDKLIRLTNTSLFIANSNWTRQQMINQGIPADHIRTKYYGVPVPDRIPERPVREQLTILHLGRLVDFKAPHLTIQAFTLAADRGLKGQLIIAGDGPLRRRCEKLRRQSRWRDRIKLVGAVSAEEGQQLYRSADIYTQHSVRGRRSKRIENFGVSPVEAMAAALPVVSTAMGGIKETVVDGQTGILGEPGDVESQAQSLLKLALDTELRRQMGLAGWQRAREHFSYEREQQELLRILHDRL